MKPSAETHHGLGYERLFGISTSRSRGFADVSIPRRCTKTTHQTALWMSFLSLKEDELSTKNPNCRQGGDANRVYFTVRLLKSGLVDKSDHDLKEKGPATATSV
jgi:hypothetical protein